MNSYYRRLADADAPRQGDTDGRGSRSQRALQAFCTFFLDCCLDQVHYMAGLLHIDGYKRRVEYLVRQASEGGLPDVPKLDRGAEGILKAVFIEGELTRAEAGKRTGYKERKARSVMADRIQKRFPVESLVHLQRVVAPSDKTFVHRIVLEAHASASSQAAPAAQPERQ